MAQSTIKLGQRFKDFVKAIADNFTDLYTNKADKTALTSHNTAADAHADRFNPLVSGVSYSEGTGVFTFTKVDGTKITVDTKLEKVVTNFTYDSTNQQLVLTLDDGTSYPIPMSAFINEYGVTDTTTIDLTMSADHKISAVIKTGSITKAMLLQAVQDEITANTNARHSHNNKSALDGINAAKITSWDAAAAASGQATKTKVSFTASDSKWGTISNGLYPLTIPHNGKSLVGGVHKTDGSSNYEVLVDVDYQTSNVVIYSADKFAGYIELV